MSTTSHARHLIIIIIFVYDPFFFFFFACRAQLRRASCNKVVPFSPKGKASLVLLRRERTSLVPRASADGDLEGVNVRRGGKSDSPGAAVVVDGDGGEKWAAAACPREGDESEQFSRLVTAQPR